MCRRDAEQTTYADTCGTVTAPSASRATQTDGKNEAWHRTDREESPTTAQRGATAHRGESARDNTRHTPAAADDGQHNQRGTAHLSTPHTAQAKVGQRLTRLQHNKHTNVPRCYPQLSSFPPPPPLPLPLHRSLLSGGHLTDMSALSSVCTSTWLPVAPMLPAPLVDCLLWRGSGS